MPLYSYKGINARSEKIRGTENAVSIKALRLLLQREQISLFEIKVLKESVEKEDKSFQRIFSKEIQWNQIFLRVTKNDVTVFSRQLATLLGAEIPLVEALFAIAEQTESVQFKTMINNIRVNVVEGISFSDALKEYPHLFDEMFVSIVHSGETAGNLNTMLNRLADVREMNQTLKSKVQSAMVYPIVMIVVSTVIMGILMVAVMPQIISIFDQQSKALPWNTALLVWVTETIRSYWFVLFGFFGGAIVMFFKWIKGTGKNSWDRFLLKLPLIGMLLRQVALARFTRTLAAMLYSGVTMLRSIDIAKKTLGNSVLEKSIETMRDKTAQGESIATSLKNTGEIPPIVTHMISVGEKAGKLEDMLIQVAKTYDRNVETKLDRLTSLIEPLMLVFMGGGVAFAVFSILGPIMDMSDITF